MKFQFEYYGDEAKKIVPRIMSFINENWRNVNFPTSNGGIGLWNYLSPTDNEWENREYNLFFFKNNILGTNHRVKITFNTSDIEKIQTNSESENIPSQIIINLKNNTSIWINKGGFESVDVYINT